MNTKEREETLLKFKAAGDSYLKIFNDPVNNLIELDNWILGYCVEKTPLIEQQTLSISHKNKCSFEADQPFKEIPELEHIFHYNPLLVFKQNFFNRGFSIMYILTGGKYT